MAKPLAQELGDLARAHGVSRDSIINGAYDPSIRGTSGTFIRKVLAGTRRPNRAMLRALANVVGEPAEVFTAYRLLVARELLDESPPKDGGVGFETAVANLAKVRGPLGLDVGDEDPRSTRELVAGRRVSDVTRRAAG